MKRMAQGETPTSVDPFWYKDAIIYETHVKTFCDSDGDGMGDFRGLIEKLDYLQELGVTAIWLLPFYPSPLRDDGYDIADYFDVNPNFGTLDDFRAFLDAAHQRNLHVITELVINHTSDQNPWFQKSRRAVAAAGAGISSDDLAYKDFYVWSDTPEKYKDSRIIFKDFETSNWAWDPVAKAYYWHRFYSHQPDLNFDNPAVHDAVEKVCDFWLGLGVDGLRLDAIPYLYERENTSCENLPETHQYLRKLRAHIDAKFPNRMLLSEANQWPEDAAAYFGNGDESHMNFHFPLMPRMFMSLQMEDRFPIIDILEQTPSIPEQCQWAMFLRNHDELTLEMVTDEERDYMYRVYATDPHARINLGIRRRLAPLLANSRRKIELLNTLLFSMPGTPIIYYGDEIGMGDNFYLGDRNGCRTPMQWSPDRNAGFSRANPQQLYLPITIDPEYHYEAVNVENQQKNLSSLLWWMRRVIAMRKNFKAFSRGSLEFLYPDNPKVLAFLRRYEDEIVLVIVNLSRFAQSAELDLSRFAGFVPMEVFSRNLFRPIRKSRYVITLGPHAYYWFALHAPTDGRRTPRKKTVPVINAPMELETLLTNGQRAAIEHEILPRYLQTCRWFGSKARTFRSLKIVEQPSISDDADSAQLWLVEVSYLDAPTETYVLPVSIASGETARALSQAAPHAIIARFAGNDENVLFDATWDVKCRSRLFDTIARREIVKARAGELVGITAKDFEADQFTSPQNSQVLGAEQSNSSMLFDNKFFLKLYRKIEDGVNPDVEITRFLTEHTKFPNVPAFVGAIEYRRPKAEPTVVCLLQSAVTNEGDVWSLTLDAVGRYYERVLGRKADLQNEIAPPGALLDELFGGVYPEKMKLLGQRTGELHLALASYPGDPAFRPEPFNAMAQRSVYQNMRASLRRAFTLLEKKLCDLPATFRDEAKEVLSAEHEILAREKRLLDRRTNAAKIRIHGDYHLGQLLYTGKDFVILDFEGEPARPLSERKLKRSALRDVAGMMRSFQYAACSALWQPAMRKEDVPFLERWADLWYRHMGSVFLQSYLKTTGSAIFIPHNSEDLQIMIEAYLLDKAVYEIGYELNNRPSWVVIPVRGIKHILKSV
ncbi:MAG: maltose alpha-D-glucosyltransferase [Verrucomicrobia bacterium 13_1_20CM_54_28]|nr:MAG: maltose alpha-D-glucosyltransferase [Verrucomicrobia bacterium 13_1_20CM_54_28]OLE11905.1 MAG: maltose alpha-D-glucosyltransferase [Verrucomicrobia bacterium 13_1_20CM_3_54_17]